MKSKFRIDELALVLIVAIIAMIASVYRNDGMGNVEAEKLTDMILDDHTLSFANKGIVDQNKLMQVQSMDYNDIKKSLKAKNDFCIHMEDEKGNVILSKGSSKLDIEGTVCRE